MTTDVILTCMHTNTVGMHKMLCIKRKVMLLQYKSKMVWKGHFENIRIINPITQLLASMETVGDTFYDVLM